MFSSKKRLILLLVLSCVLLLMVGCKLFTGEKEKETYTLSGVVLDIEGEGLEGVTLYFSGDFGTVQTDEDGKWNMTELQGTVTLKPVKDDLVFDPREKTINEEAENVEIVEAIFDDPHLQKPLKEEIGKEPDETIFLDDVVHLEELEAKGVGIESLEGIQYLQSLTHLDVGWYYNFDEEKYFNNYIEDISPLETLTSLEVLYFRGNQVSDISGVENLTNLRRVDFGGNQVTDISAVENLTNLEELYFEENEVSDISAIENLTNLEVLYSRGNQVTDISALVANEGFGSGDEIDMRENYLDLKDSDILDDIDALKDRGVELEYEPQREPGGSGTSSKFFEDKGQERMREIWKEKYRKEDSEVY